MNWTAFIVAIAGVTTILAAYVALIFRDRARELEIADAALLDGQRKLIEEQGKLITEQRRLIGNLKRTHGEYLDAADLMNDCNAELERRNEWLEQRRYVILRRWWRRAGQRQRIWLRWQVRKQ